jgi:palmitoyl transferase
MQLKKQALILLMMVFPVYAEESADNTKADDPFPVILWDRLISNSSRTWQSPSHHELYLPLFSWHLPFAWDSERRKEYNENAWGAGYGLTRYDAEGDWHGLYLMVFRDSLDEWEPVGGYGYEKIWHPLQQHQDFRLGLGLTAGITLRDNWHYVPVPYVLPLGSIGYKDLTFQATYVPGLRNKGNVFLGWIRWQFD